MLDTGRCPSRPEGCAPAHCRPSRLTTGVGGTPDAGAHGTQPGRKRGAKDGPTGRPERIPFAPALRPHPDSPLLDPRAVAPHNDGMNIRLFLGGHGLPKPSRGRGRGETGFPRPQPPPAGGRSRTPTPAGEGEGGGGVIGRAQPSQTLPPGGGMGKPGFPVPLLEGCSFTLPRAGARGKPRLPPPSLPRWGEEPHSRPGGGGLAIGWSP